MATTASAPADANNASGNAARRATRREVLGACAFTRFAAFLRLPAECISRLPAAATRLFVYFGMRVHCCGLFVNVRVRHFSAGMPIISGANNNSTLRNGVCVWYGVVCVYGMMRCGAVRCVCVKVTAPDGTKTEVTAPPGVGPGSLVRCVRWCAHFCRSWTASVGGRHVAVQSTTPSAACLPFCFLPITTMQSHAMLSKNE